MATEDDFKRIGNYARMYNRDQGIDRRNATRTVPMEVLSLGYSRTGTLTMQKALTILGYPNPYHFSSFYDNIRDIDLWMEALNAKFHGKGPMPGKAFFDGLLGHVGAVADVPCILFAKELVQFYPDAKVVLVERDIDSWFRSWMAFCEGVFAKSLYYATRLDPFWAGKVAQIGYETVSICAGYGTSLDEARVRSKNAYRHHYRDVREMVPRERLLNFKPEEGWQPLCEFLGRPVPDVPFPHENKKESNRLSLRAVGQKALWNVARNILIVIAVVGAPLTAFYWHRHRS